MDSGLRYVYTGNIHNTEIGTTFCPTCQAALIERDWYAIRRYDLQPDGACHIADKELPAISAVSASRLVRIIYRQLARR